MITYTRGLRVEIGGFFADGLRQSVAAEALERAGL
jgi:hypothetical protein